MINILAVGCGGFVGATLRYLIGLIPLNEAMVFPVKTFVINIVGCILIGTLAVTASRNAEFSPQMMLFLKVGLCGGFTTFSTFALETADLMKNGHNGAAFLYILLSVVIGVSVIFAVEYMTAR